MLTSFTRIVIVLSLLRQALGLQQTPAQHRDHRARDVPHDDRDGADLDSGFVTLPLDPYMAGKLRPRRPRRKAEAPLRDFMLRQTRTEDIVMARGLLAKSNLGLPTRDAQSTPLLCAGAGVRVERADLGLPGRLSDLPAVSGYRSVVAAVLMALGMFMLPPTVITIPLKLLVFVLASGWPLLLGNLRAVSHRKPSIMNYSIAADLFRAAL